MAGSTGERPLGDIVTDPQFWLLHIVNFPAIFLSGWLFVGTGLAYDVFGTPRPNEYYLMTGQENLPIIENRLEAKKQLDQYFLQQQVDEQAPALK
ncbi:MAG: cytochrome b559 subunit alpha [Okeania sp. SIO2G4]|uniref:cytochrome b559 subunit alpha n=1 Tax=unclassified Okeania TaxID=2634635 RepID=UPI0013B60ADD|nr:MULTISPECIES: cytochrome b559 subunit alpha [unclassified Okeania]NEP05051.1 cytochrome b559 subunit alpha [Okeania sp. SIO4D6]NEP41901.1 cytochrome b559 subunit alpha [Okeania sp. SIO2H7]NEP73282.1 cytochrome b559 subunit alpha [Okeania sp. SIO2G5]NEP91694.1 cytochrome b559 subunit alpha [Okeania sp. SIO2F5]NEQ89521.1 cytochrome b559 subunit alpha [Okeania sp. SIO2G4]